MKDIENGFQNFFEKMKSVNKQKSNKLLNLVHFFPSSPFFFLLGSDHEGAADL